MQSIPYVGANISGIKRQISAFSALEESLEKLPSTVCYSPDGKFDVLAAISMLKRSMTGQESVSFIQDIWLWGLKRIHLLVQPCSPY
jgi:hypothetical protein